MGCTSSKLDDLPAVILCRERCTFLSTAIAQRYALAEAHVAYTHSLKEIGISLDRFFDQDLDNNFSSSPFLNLPPHKKGDPVPIDISTAAAAAASVSISSPPAKVVDYHPHSHSHSHSNSGHLEFQDSDDDDDDDDDGSLHHSGNSSPLHYQHHYHDDETLNPINGGFMNMNFMQNRSTQSVIHQQRPMSTEKVHMNMNFMQNRSTQSVVHEQRPMSPETVNMSSGSSYFPYNYSNYENPNPNPYPYYNYPQPSYSNYGYYGSSMGGMGSQPYGSGYPQQQETRASSSSASSSKPPPPPPSPPRSSAWDFLNFFETVETSYPDNTPSRDSRSVREEEGIPDLEDENFQDEVVKEVHGEQRFSDGGAKYSKKKKMEAEEKGVEGIYEAKQNMAGENDGMEYDVHVVDKKVIANEERSEEKGNVASFKAKVGSRGVSVSVVIREIKSHFERASESGNEVSAMLEAGKVQFHRKNAVYQVSSKMLHSITPSLSVVSSQPSSSKNAETSSNAGSIYLDIDEGLGIRSGNLSSTLQKLYIWEKKLYDEVKAEEKMRIIHERKVRRLKRLDEKGAESQKIDSTRTLVRSLSTKIRIAIQVVDKISVKINKLRDEELWPQINELIKGLIRMWKVMLECHQSQSQAIAEAKSLDALTSNWKLNGDHLQATLQLEHELLHWISNFSSWVGAQKGYIKALNNWLVKCLFYEPEVTDDGPVPFSPSRLGAPPVFVICNQWSQAMDRISEKEVIDAMRVFTLSVRQISERHNVEFRQRLPASKDMERKVKELEREEHKMQKEWQNTDRKMTLLSGQGIGAPQVVYQSETVTGSLHLGLKNIFEAMERFTASSMQVYEELQMRCDEERVARENANDNKAP